VPQSCRRPGRRPAGPLCRARPGCADGIVDVGLQRREFRLQGRQQTGHTLLQRLAGQALLALTLGDDHVDDLTAPCEQIGQTLGIGIAQRPHGRLGRCDEVGNDASVQRIGLGALTQCQSKGANLSGSDNDHGQRGGSKAGRHAALIAAGRLQGDDLRRERVEAVDQSAKPGCIA
jgi:hypothetical protein